MLVSWKALQYPPSAFLSHMASDQSFVDFVHEQAGLADALTSKKMFGEYGLYLDGKFIAVICDNQLFVKPNDAARAMLAEVVEQPPYPGAKPWLRIGDEVDDRALLRRLLTATAGALPASRPKKVAKKVVKKVVKKTGGKVA